jgi:hypothetical protein
MVTVVFCVPLQTSCETPTKAVVDVFPVSGSVQLNAGSSSKAFIPVIPAGIPTGRLMKVYMYSLHVSRGTTPLG